MFTWVLFVCSSLSLAQGFRLVGESGQCYKNDPNINTCLLQAFNNLKPQIRRGYERFGIPPFDPALFIKEINVTHSSDEGYFNSKLTNLVLGGLYNYEVTKVDYTEDKLMIDVKFDILNISSEYSNDGVFLNAPVKGEGKGNDVNGPVVTSVVVLKDTIKKENVEHCNILGVKFTWHSTFTDAHIDPIINSDTNKTAIDYAEDKKKVIANILFKVFKLTFDTIFGTLWTQYLKNMCDVVPYADLFPVRS